MHAVVKAEVGSDRQVVIDFFQAFVQGCFITDDAHVFLHGFRGHVPDVRGREGALRTGHGCQFFCLFIRISRKVTGVFTEGSFSQGIGCYPGPVDRREHGVAAKPVGAVVHAGAFADRKEIGDVGFVVHMHGQAAHEEVHGRGDRDRFFLDVNAAVSGTEIPDFTQAVINDLRVQE